MRSCCPTTSQILGPPGIGFSPAVVDVKFMLSDASVIVYFWVCLFFLLRFYVPLVVYLILYLFLLCTVRRMICILFGILFNFHLDMVFCLLDGIILIWVYLLAYSLILYCMVSITCSLQCSLVPNLLWYIILKYTELLPWIHCDYQPNYYSLYFQMFCDMIWWYFCHSHWFPRTFLLFFISCAKFSSLYRVDARWNLLVCVDFLNTLKVKDRSSCFWIKRSWK